MRKGNKKGKWSKPKLIVLARGKPEERVLAYCKADPGAGPGSRERHCNPTGQCHTACHDGPPS